MEYFNTFGGSPVATRVGKAVLDVMREDRVLDHVQDVGPYFKSRLKELQTKHEIVGDVRGEGLFLGLELVTDRASNTPAPAEKTWFAIVGDVRGEGLFLGLELVTDRAFNTPAPAEIVGDVRGEGLFLGLELVTDRAFNTPAPAEASYLVAAARQHGASYLIEAR
ncbi:pyridoxal phosphate-dependent transferase [Baffinella frigidus]|nr:pyridoxal phosphate-dependent transferase [Cryptophyta sp. CCMP2293]